MISGQQGHRLKTSSHKVSRKVFELLKLSPPGTARHAKTVDVVDEDALLPDIEVAGSGTAEMIPIS